MHGLDQPQSINARFERALGEGAVTIVAVKFAAVGVSRRRLVSDKNIDPAVVVEIKPRCRLGRMEAQQSGFFRHIVKSAVPVVAEK